GELLSMLNPISHTRMGPGPYRYRVEPYVAAGDIYSEHPHTGRGGWTWYTGSAGWVLPPARAGGPRVCPPRAVPRVDPCIPRGWRRYQATFRYHSSRYQITVENPQGVSRGIAELRSDGRRLPPGAEGVPLVDDGGLHRVDVLLG